MDFSQRRAIEFSAAELAGILNTCFEGYMVSFTLDGGSFERRFRPEGLDTIVSLILFDGENPAGVCLIARQGWTSRVAAMAIAPNYRSQGVGKLMMNQVIQEARDRGDHRMVLEVIEQNEPAIRLYESVGMTRTRRLVGYKRDAHKGKKADLFEIDPAAFVRFQAQECEDDLPWDYKPETLTLKPDIKAYSFQDKAFALVSEAPTRIIIWSFFTKQKLRRKGVGTALIHALANHYSDRSFAMPIAAPDDLASEFMAKLNFEVPEITQLEMEIVF